MSTIAAHRAPAGKPLILTIDDNADNLMFLGELLEPQYDTRFAKSGPQGLAAARMDPRPDLILLDLMMPGMDGFEVFRRLRDDDRTRDIPVIFVTAKDSFESEEQGLTLGAVDYVTKPLSPPVVLARLATHLELKRARDQLAAHAADLEAEVARRTRDIEIVQQAAIRALASLGETRDSETGHHILRTQLYIDVLGRRLQAHPRFAAALAPHRLRMIVEAAPLHDIGKIGIRDEILLKPGKLTPEEFAVMKTHAALGGEALDRAIREATRLNGAHRGAHGGAHGGVHEGAHGGAHGDAHRGAGGPGLAPAAADGAGVGFQDPGAGESGPADCTGPLEFLRVAREIAAGHHEKWDGSGYPLGLSGDAIPVSARLMALADVFDALISRRVYKAPMPLAQVRGIIAEGRGRHFDPDIVDAFFAGLPDFLEIAHRYADDAGEPAVPAAA